MGEIKRASDLLGEVFRHIEKNEFERAQTMSSCWKDAVGEKAYAHSRITDLSKGVLHVEVSHPGWIQLIQLRRKEVLHFLKKKFPDLEINTLAFHLTDTENSSSLGKAAPITREEMLKRIEARSPSDIPSVQEQSGAVKNGEKGGTSAPEMNEELAALFKKLRKTVKEKGIQN